MLLGNKDGAEWEAQEIRAIAPNFSTRAWLATYPMTDIGQQEQLASALAALGLSGGQDPPYLLESALAEHERRRPLVE